MSRKGKTGGTETQERQQLGFLTQGNDEALSQCKKSAKMNLRVGGPDNRVKASNVFFDNRIDLITTEELATIFRVAPQTIRNWVARGKIPHIQIGRRNLFQQRSLQKWLNQKEEPLWE